MPIICAMTGVRSFGGVGGSGDSSYSYDYWISMLDSSTDTAWYDSANDKIHVTENNTNAPKVISLTTDGNIDPLYQGRVGSTTNTQYEEFNDPGHGEGDTWYVATAHNSTGSGKTAYPFTSFNTYYNTGNGNGGQIIYSTGTSGVTVTGKGTSNETIHATSASVASGGANTSELYYAIHYDMSNNMRRLHRTVFSGYTRVYPHGIAGSSAINKIGIAMGLSSTGSGPYPASFMVHTFTPSNGAINSTSSTKRMVAANSWAYTMRMTSWSKSTRWIHAIRCDYGDDTHHLISWDENTNVKDQICFDMTKATYEGIVFNYNGNSTATGPYILLMKDAVTANRYYLVTWNNDDNNVSTNGGSNTGGFFNQDNNAVQIDFTDGQTYTSNTGRARGEMVGTDKFVLCADIGPNSEGIVFYLPSDLSQISDLTGTNVNITTGSTVQSTVNTFVRMASQKSFTTVSSSTSLHTTNTTSATVTMSSNSWTSQDFAEEISTGTPSSAFDSTRIFIPYYSSTYTSLNQLYNFETNTLTSFGTQGNNYMASVGGGGSLSICEANGGNIVGLASQNTNNTSYTNMIHVNTSDSISYLRMDPHNYAAYGTYFGEVTWNPNQSKFMTSTNPHYNIGNTTNYVTFDTDGTYTTYSGNYPGHQTMKPLKRMYERDSYGRITFGDYMLSAGATWGTGQAVYIERDQDPYSTPNFSASAAGSTWSYPRTRALAPLTKDIAIVLTGGYGDFLYNPVTDQKTAITWDDLYVKVNYTGEPGKYGLTHISKYVLCATDNNKCIVFKADTSFNIAWAIDLYNVVASASNPMNIEMIIGAGKDLYMWHHQSNSPNQHYFSKFELDGVGGYTHTQKTLSGLTASQAYTFVHYDYFD